MQNRYNKLFSVIVFFVLLTFASCSRNSNSSQPLYTSADTTLVYEMADSYLSLLHDNRFDDALNMLFEVSNDSIVPISEESRNNYFTQFETFPVVSFERTAVDWNDWSILLNYRICFSENSTNSTPFFYNIQLQPVRKDGLWYLTTVNKSTVK